MSSQAMIWGDKQVMHISKWATKCLFERLCRWADENDEVSFSIKWLSSELYDCPESTIKSAKKQLEELGLMTKSRRGNQYQGSLYKLNLFVDLNEKQVQKTDLQNDKEVQKTTSAPEVQVQKTTHASDVQVQNTVGVSPIYCGSKSKKLPSNNILITSLINKEIDEYPDWVKILMSLDFTDEKHLTPKWIQLMEKIHTPDHLELEAYDFIKWVTLPKYQGKYSDVTRVFRNHLKDKKPKVKTNGDFNPSGGGNMNEILKMSKTYNKEIKV